MALATAGRDGRPSVRMVLLKGHGPDGFDFYTNDDSRKGEQLADNPQAALLFHWKSLRRQVRDRRPGRGIAGGRGRRLFRDPQPGFAARRLGIRPVASARQPRHLRARYEEMKQRFEGEHVPRPPHWGGYRLVAEQYRILDGPATPAARAPPVHADGGDGWTEGLLYP